MNNYTTELYHHGIKGQKWGVRRYQNKDGSRTVLGKKHRSDPHEDYTRAHTKKSVKEMSDDELRMRNNRLNMEVQYSNLTDKQKNAGHRFVKTIAKEIAKEIVKEKVKAEIKKRI